MIYKVENLSFNYPNSKLLFNNISFNIEKGQLYTILGKNGVGKTTLFNCLLNFNTKYNGQILLNDKDIKTLKEKEVAKLVSYVPQSTNCSFDYTVFEFVLMGTASNISLFSSPSSDEEKLVTKALKELNITNLADKKFNELSGGEQQLVLIARAIVNNPEVIFFDEPTSHLDYSNQIKVLRILNNLKEKGYTIILTTHDPNHALLLKGNCILFGNKGTIQKGEANKILTKKNLQLVYGKELEIKYLKEYKRNVVIYPTL